MHAAVKENRSSRPANQLVVNLNRASIPAQCINRGNHRSVIIRPVSHHSSVVFRHNQSVGHHFDDSVVPFRHDTSVCRSQRGSLSGMTASIAQTAYSLVTAHTTGGTVRELNPEAHTHRRTLYSTVAKTHQLTASLRSLSNVEPGFLTGINRKIKSRRALRQQSCSKQRRKSTEIYRRRVRMNSNYRGFTGENDEEYQVQNKLSVEQHMPPPPYSQIAAADRRPTPPPLPPSSSEIRSGQFDEKNPSVQILSGLLVQADEGVSYPVVDLIGIIYRSLPSRRPKHHRTSTACGGATTSAIARAGRALATRSSCERPRAGRENCDASRCDGSMLADRCYDTAGRSVREAFRPTHVAGCAICANARAGRALASRWPRAGLALAARLPHERQPSVAPLLVDDACRWSMMVRRGWALVARNWLHGRAPVCDLASHFFHGGAAAGRPPLRRIPGDVVTADFF
ncbi:hypothetical protein F511_34953 [Dorcoceras hygrometricum]|uniref:Uncharacterized protein n=1 Tax=Dorcoceras hygrometricum TaxID=472368 RepID=A0A2Z7AKR7_9LAMI|nr:hypothetical protein F511_34953 [Dorcoceras hygrometricum]